MEIKHSMKKKNKLNDILKILHNYKEEYDFLAKEHIESHNIQQAKIYEEKSKTINDLLNEITGEKK